MAIIKKSGNMKDLNQRSYTNKGISTKWAKMTE